MEGAAFVNYRTTLKCRVCTEASSPLNSTCPLHSGPEMVRAVNNAVPLRKGDSCVGIPTCHFADFQTTTTGIAVLLNKCKMMWSYFKACFAFHWLQLKSSDFYLFLVYVSEKSTCPFELCLYLKNSYFLLREVLESISWGSAGHN